MTRVIKFRGYIESQKRFVYGDLDQNSVYHPCVIREHGVITNEVVPESVGQYTGLKDKNGKEIYEGDVLAAGESMIKFMVFWDMDGASFKIKFTDIEHTGRNFLKLEATKYHTVIGNIYENPELISK